MGNWFSGVEGFSSVVHDPIQPSNGAGASEPSQGDRTLLQTVQEGRPSGELRSPTLTQLTSSDKRFKMLRVHATGGLGIVSVAWDSELQREVAIKEMRPELNSPEAGQRFLFEAHLTGQLDHPGIPPVHALGCFDDGRLFYVMRLIDGVTLKQAISDFANQYPLPLVTSERTMDLRKLLVAFCSVCQTLRYAHSRNVLHRDIKPSNIMLGEFGETMVLDWGLAKSNEQSPPLVIFESKSQNSSRRSDDPSLTGTGSVLGTPHYMSPEQAHGEWDDVNVRSEVYSLGATLFTILTGKLPYEGTTREAVLARVRSGEKRSAALVDPRVPRELDAICSKAMALNREDRFSSAGELALAIEQWLADEPVTCYREPRLRRWSRWLKSHQSMVVGLAALLLTGLTAVVISGIVLRWEHNRVNDQMQAAVIATERAERDIEETRVAVARLLTVTVSDRLAQMPGSEWARMALTDATLPLIEKWAMESPNDARRRLDLIDALRQRATLYEQLGQKASGMEDLMRAMELVRYPFQSENDSTHQSFASTRLVIAVEMANLMKQLQGPSPALAFFRESYRLASTNYYVDPSNVARRCTFAMTSFMMAELLFELDRDLEAMEHIERASSEWESLFYESDQALVRDTIIDARNPILDNLCKTRLLHGRLAQRMGDSLLARECYQRVQRACAADDQAAETLLTKLVFQLEALAFEVELSIAVDDSVVSLERARKASQSAERLARRANLASWARSACGRIQLALAEQELRGGALGSAADAVSKAMLVIAGDDSPRQHLMMARAYRISAEINLAEGDAWVALAYCYAARTAISDLVPMEAGDDERHIESLRIEQLQGQIELIK